MTATTVDPRTVQDAPRFLVSYSFQARDAAAAQAATDAVQNAMLTSDALPAFDDLAFFKPVQVATNVAPAGSGRKVLRLDAAEVSDLMAALMDAIETQDGREDADDDDEEAERARLAAAYRALADKLMRAQRDGIA